MSRTIDMNKLRAGRALAGLSIRELTQRAGEMHRQCSASSGVTW